LITVAVIINITVRIVLSYTAKIELL